MAEIRTDMLNWSDPIPLSQYKRAPTGTGIYAIGRQRDESTLPTASMEYDAYLGRWPDNFHPMYVGISLSKGCGIRGRLSAHSRNKGNKCIARYQAQGTKFWFITVQGEECAEYEAGFILLKTKNQFECNVRCEITRSTQRQGEKILSAMTEQEKAYYADLDMGEHGEGM